MRRTLVIVMAVLLISVGTGYAGSVGTLTTFTPNTPAHAESVNDNFTAVETAVNDNAADITTNADGMSSNADSITDIKGQLGGKLDKPTCTDGQVLKYSSGVWVCAEDIDTTNTDADTLDGLDSTYFALSSHSHSSTSSIQYISVSFLGGGYNWNMEKVAVDDDDNFANADTSIWWEGLSPSFIDSTDRGVVYADIQLPDGATITEYGMVYYDEIGDSHTVVSQLRRTPEKIGIATIISPGIAFTPQYAWITSIDPAVADVDNFSYSYHIRAQMQGGLDMAVISAMVGYKLP